MRGIDAELASAFDEGRTAGRADNDAAINCPYEYKTQSAYRTAWFNGFAIGCGEVTWELPKTPPRRTLRLDWTADDDAALRRLHEAGHVVSEIRAELDRSSFAVGYRLRFLGLRPRRG